jgi:hypothetical protein
MGRKLLVIGLAFLTVAVMSVFNDVSATLIGDDMSVRVKGWQSGNWGVGLGDQVGTSGGFVQAFGDNPWVATDIYSFSLTYSAGTGLATFTVNGSGYNSVLTSADYGINGYGFSGITLGLKDRDTTGLTLSNLTLNGSLIGSYEATTTYTTYTLYTGSLLNDITLTGQFVMTGDYSGNNEGTKFDLNLTGARQSAVVPIPGAAWLLGPGLLGLVGLKRKYLG